ncbi:MAG TPA: acyloxyacyl hydrolase, partial [Thermodesulfobacteriota bacterium]|nr:acyloxyacyl hydrolase [Thermodesulfobacteriota bacterium]
GLLGPVVIGLLVTLGTPPALAAARGPLAPGAVEWSTLSGYGRSVALTGPSPRTDLILVAPRVGYVVAAVERPAPAGSVEIAGELPLLVASGSGTVYGGGLTGLVAYHVATRSRLVPFVGAAAGFLLSGPRPPEEDSQFHASRFNFTLQAAAGLRYRLGRGGTIGLEYRFFHVSNGRLYERNPGLNANLVLLGVSIFR